MDKIGRAVGIVMLAVISGLTGCSPAGLLNATVPSNGASVIHDIAYAPGPSHTLDVYRPEKATGPLVVFLFGGSWRMGDKSMYPFVALPLAARGAVVVVPNYRLYPQVEFPEFVNDNAAAVKWAFDHAASLGADPKSIFVVGHSAGAYNSAMLALDPHYLADAGTSRDRLAGVVGLAGPYDFLPIIDPDIIPVFASVQDGPASQPVTYVDGHNPPMLLLAGKDDTIVRPQNTLSLDQHIRAAGGPVEAKLYPDLGHIGLVIAFAPLFQGRAPVLNDVWQFIQNHQHPPVHLP
jgi:acetyl esterase/lipase